MQSLKNNTLTLMVQGTTSDAGKSTLVTALCRFFLRQGLSVAPFKPQNMALNSAVTADGGEIGRAQAVQAAACGLEAHTDMNPVLLKPGINGSAQIIIHGQAQTNLTGEKFAAYKKQAMPAVLESYQRLKKQYQIIVVEGAGSPAEINLRKNDIANMGFAEAVDCPVILVADIDKGGVFAHIVGTLALLSESEQTRIIGFVINRFRGDIALLQPGIDWLEQRLGKPVLAVLPYLNELYLDAEDSVSLNRYQNQNKSDFTVVVPMLPRISNHTDFDPLQLHDEVALQFAYKPDDCADADLIILPGSKTVRSDLEWLQATGWFDYIKRHLRYGGRVLGICGGFQMLGKAIHDPNGIEGNLGCSIGLGFLDMETTLQATKQLQRVTGYITFNHSPVAGYEIHAGLTTGHALSHPAIMLNGKPEGAMSADGQIMGTYLHGLFDQPEACQTLLNWAGCQSKKSPGIAQLREDGINLIADALEQSLDAVMLQRALDLFYKQNSSV